MGKVGCERKTGGRRPGWTADVKMGQQERSRRAKEQRGQQVKKRDQGNEEWGAGEGREVPVHRFVPIPLTPHRPRRPHTSAMIFSNSRFSFSNSRDFSSSLLLVDEPVFMVSCASDCHSPRVISLRIWGRRFAA